MVLAARNCYHSGVLVTCSWVIDPDRSVRDGRISARDRLDLLERLERDPLRWDLCERDLGEVSPKECPGSGSG